MILLEKLVCNKGENRAEFEKKLRNIADLIGVSPNWLMIMFYNESRINAQAVNKQKGDTETDAYKRAAFRATGLMQFMPETAKGMGTTTQKLYQMSAIEQLDYVYKYYKSFAGKLSCYTDLYMACFFPVAIGKPDDWVLQTKDLSASKIATQNAGFDLNKDGKITVGEAKAAMLKVVPAAYLEFVIEKKTLHSPDLVQS